MEVEKTASSMDCDNKVEDDIPLPGFRFHPTDEELVGFYLRRKVEKKPITIELIKQVDIYKYDPWDLSKEGNVGDKEWYFFCKRERKYKNSVRPNRVASSGFWKATGIDRPIYSTTGGGLEKRHQCIGLKKSLVYYRGSAGKGTKTEWMMHEFRLPSHHDDDKTTKHFDLHVNNIIAQEAEVWTICRILKRNSSPKKLMPDWRERSTQENINPPIAASSKPCSSNSKTSHESHNIDFRAPATFLKDKNFANQTNYETNQTRLIQFSSTSQAHSETTYSSFFSHDVNEIIKNGGWDELRSVAELNIVDPFLSVKNL